MTQTSNRLYDEFARLMNDAAGVASGVRREVETMVRNQADRWLRDMDLIKRDEFDAVKEMARLAREENEALKARIAALEARLPPNLGRLTSCQDADSSSGFALRPSRVRAAAPAACAFLVIAPERRYKPAFRGSDTPGGMPRYLRKDLPWRTSSR